MNRIKDILNKNKKIIVISFMIFLTIMLPYMQDDFIIGDDYEYHFSRIDSIEEALREKIFPVKVHPKLANGYGYGTGLFYPNLFLYIPAILGLMGLDFFLSYKIFIAVMVLLMIILTYICLKSIVEEQNTALIGTTIIMLSSCLSLQLYSRIALGEFLGLIFIIPIVAGMYDYIYNDFKRPWMLFVGFWGVINSHLITTLICLIYCIIIFVCHIKTSLKNLKKMVKLIIIAILVLLVTACFWMPMIEQMIGYKFKYSNQWMSSENDIYGLYDLFSNGRFSLGVFITLCLPMIINSIFDKNISNTAKKFLRVFIILVIIMITPQIWKWTKDITGIIQFKWRLLGITTVIAGITVAILLMEYCSKKKFNTDLLLFIVLAIAMFVFNTQYMRGTLADEKFVESKMYSLWNSIGGGCEYLPLETNLEDLYYPQYIMADDGEKIEYIRTFGRIEFMKTNPKQNIINPPIIYYYGYVADITKEDGAVIPLEVRKSESGLLEVDTKGETGNIRIWYNGTKIQKISYLISVFTIFVLISVIIINQIKKKINSIKK